MQLPAIAPSIRQAHPEERTALDAPCVQLQVLHEELEPDYLSQMHLHRLSCQVQGHSYHLRPFDVRSC